MVTCSEDEWHVLPARMFSEELRQLGWDTIFLGGSAPADELGEYLESNQVTAVAVSCSIAVHLAGAARVIAACHDRDTPVLVGGAAFGSSDRRARALGADAWAPEAMSADRLLARMRTDVSVRATPPLPPDAVALGDVRSSIVDDAMRTLAERFPPMLDFDDRQLLKTREDFDYIVEFLGASLLVRDPAVFLEFVQWLAEVLAATPLPPGVLSLSLHVVEDVIPDVHGSARDLVAVAIESLEHEPTPGSGQRTSGPE